ncbi:MAG: hypothetical protein AAFQ17_05855, partial [Pseudomonadota bacterium]
LRPYRKSAGPDAAPQAFEIIHEHTGTHYDPEAVELFSDLYESGELDWILSYYNDCDDFHDIESRTEIALEGAEGFHDDRR